MSPARNWNVAVWMVAVGAGAAVALAALSMVVGGVVPAALLAAGHVVVSLAAGAVAGAVMGPNAAVGLHLGMYNLATPAAVYLRSAWLVRNRPGFLSRGFFPLFVGLYLLAAAGAWAVWK